MLKSSTTFCISTTSACDFASPSMANSSHLSPIFVVIPEKHFTKGSRKAIKRACAWKIWENKLCRKTEMRVGTQIVCHVYRKNILETRKSLIPGGCLGEVENANSKRHLEMTRKILKEFLEWEGNFF